MHWDPTGQTVNNEYYVEFLREFSKRFRRRRPAFFKLAQWHFHQDNRPVHNSILVTDNLTKMGIKKFPHPLIVQTLLLVTFDYSLSSRKNLEAVVMRQLRRIKVIDTLTEEGFHAPFHNLLERYNQCIATGGDYFEVDLSFMCVLSINVPTGKKSGNLFNDPRKLRISNRIAKFQL